MGFNTAAATTRDVRQPAAAGDGSALKSPTPRYGDGLGRPGFRRLRSGRFWGNPHGRPGEDTVTRPVRNSHGRYAASCLRVCAGPCWHSWRCDAGRWGSRRCVWSDHQRGRRRRDRDPRRARYHPIGRANRHGQRHECQPQRANSWTTQHALCGPLSRAKAVASMARLSSRLLGGNRRCLLQQS